MAGTPLAGTGTPPDGTGNPPGWDWDPPRLGLGPPQLGLGSPRLGLEPPWLGLGPPWLGLGPLWLGLGPPQLGLGPPPGWDWDPLPTWDWDPPFPVTEKLRLWRTNKCLLKLQYAYHFLIIFLVSFSLIVAVTILQICVLSLQRFTARCQVYIIIYFLTSF